MTGEHYALSQFVLLNDLNNCQSPTLHVTVNYAHAGVVSVNL